MLSNTIQQTPRPLLPPTSRAEIQPTTSLPSSNKSTQSKSTLGICDPSANFTHFSSPVFFFFSLFLKGIFTVPLFFLGGGPPINTFLSLDSQRHVCECLCCKIVNRYSLNQEAIIQISPLPCYRTSVFRTVRGITFQENRAGRGSGVPSLVGKFKQRTV